MCRNIKTLANFEPPATDGEIRASALQFVRKLSGSSHPSRANEAVFNRAVEEVTEAARRLIDSLSSSAPRKNRDEEARKARDRARARRRGRTLRPHEHIRLLPPSVDGSWRPRVASGARGRTGRPCGPRPRSDR